MNVNKRKKTVHFFLFSEASSATSFYKNSWYLLEIKFRTGKINIRVIFAVDEIGLIFAVANYLYLIPNK